LSIKIFVTSGDEVKLLQLKTYVAKVHDIAEGSISCWGDWILTHFKLTF